MKFRIVYNVDFYGILRDFSGFYGTFEEPMKSNNFYKWNKLINEVENCENIRFLGDFSGYFGTFEEPMESKKFYKWNESS